MHSHLCEEDTDCQWEHELSEYQGFFTGKGVIDGLCISVRKRESMLLYINLP